jgi:HAD superfamily hydrolase (TIGR01549 family)
MTTVFLDAGGVLVWPNWTRVSEALRRHGVDVPAERLAAADPAARAAMDRAELISDETDQRRGLRFWDLVLAGAGVEWSAAVRDAFQELDRYHAEHNLWELVPDFVAPALRSLRADGHALVVVSNSNGTLHRAFDRLQLTELVDLVIDSAIEGIEKPDPRLFELALTRVDASAASTVHVGDFYHIDVTGARRAGLGAVLVDEANLRPDVDCPRIRSIAELPALLATISA